MQRRIGNHFITKRTDYGRSKRLKLQEISLAELRRIYQEQARDKLPLTEAEFREAISAEYMVFGRKGLGGGAVKRSKKVLLVARKNINQDFDGLDSKKNKAHQKNGLANDLFNKLIA
jgi:argininosuccinate lyase